MLALTIAACIICALTTIITFGLYVRARLANREEHPRHTPEQHQAKLDALDKLEKRYQSIHFISLGLFVLFGVILLVQISNRIP